MRLEARTLPSRTILGVDIENKPLWYGGGDYVYDRVVCVSWKFVGLPKTETRWIDWGAGDDDLLWELDPLRTAIESADSLLGHNFKHDWKGLQSVFNYLRQPPLKARPVIDTMRCLPSGIPRSLEFLSNHFSLPEKPHVSPNTWIDAVDRGRQDAIGLVIARNRADVEITEELYKKEKEVGWL